MTKNVKIAIAIGSGLAVGFGGWYLYQYIQKRNEDKKLANLTPTDTGKPTQTPVSTSVNTPVNSPVATTFSNPILLSGHKPLKFNPKLQQSVSIANQSQNTASSFNGQEMVTRYQRPFWTVGG